MKSRKDNDKEPFMSKEWFERRVDLEDGAEIGAGSLPLSIPRPNRFSDSVAEEHFDQLLLGYFEARIKVLELKLSELKFNKELKIFDHIKPLDFLKEFGTINLDFGRITGKTFFIATYLLPKLKDKCLVVTRIGRSRDVFLDSYPFSRTYKNNIYTIRNFLNLGKLNSLVNATCVVVDDSAILSKVEISAIQSVAATYGIEIVILC